MKSQSEGLLVLILIFQNINPVQRRNLALSPVLLGAPFLAMFLKTPPCRWPFQGFLPVLGPCLSQVPGNCP